MFKFFSRKDKFCLSLIRKFLSKQEYLKIYWLLRRDKLSIKLKSFGRSFLITDLDIMPKIESEDKEILKLNHKIEKNYEKYTLLEFSKRVKKVLPEYIGPTIPAPKNVKEKISEALLTGKSLLIVDETGYAHRLKSSAEKLGKVNITVSKELKDGFDIVILTQKEELGKYRELSHKNSIHVKIKDADIKFLKYFLRRVKISETLKK